MLTQTLLPRHHYKPYHYQCHLLYQFILSEILLAHTEMQQIKGMQEQGALPQALGAHLVKLSGSAQEYMRLFSWNDDSILAKLKSYCDLFLPLGQEEALDMYNEANKAWLLSLETMALIRKSNPSPELLEALLKKIQRCLTRIAKIASQIAFQFKHDENVILFFLRNQEKLDALYGKKFTNKLLRKIFPKGLKEMQLFLIEKYSHRGFEHIAPVINSYVTQLSTP